MAGTGIHLHQQNRPIVGCSIVSMHRCLIPFFCSRVSKINLGLRASFAPVELEMRTRTRIIQGRDSSRYKSEVFYLVADGVTDTGF